VTVQGRFREEGARQGGTREKFLPRKGKSLPPKARAKGCDEGTLSSKKLRRKKKKTRSVLREKKTSGTRRGENSEKGAPGAPGRRLQGEQEKASTGGTTATARKKKKGRTSNLRKKKKEYNQSMRVRKKKRYSRRGKGGAKDKRRSRKKAPEPLRGGSINSFGKEGLEKRESWRKKEGEGRTRFRKTKKRGGVAPSGKRALEGRPRRGHRKGIRNCFRPERQISSGKKSTVVERKRGGGETRRRSPLGHLLVQ